MVTNHVEKSTSMNLNLMCSLIKKKVREVELYCIKNAIVNYEMQNFSKHVHLFKCLLVFFITNCSGGKSVFSLKYVKNYL